jgi:hypothetical protein
LIDGVEIDEDGAPVAYHVADSYPLSRYGSLGPTDWKRVAVYGADSGHGARSYTSSSRIGRPDARRSDLRARSRDAEADLATREAELMASVINSFFTVFIKRRA